MHDTEPCRVIMLFPPYNEQQEREFDYRRQLRNLGSYKDLRQPLVFDLILVLVRTIINAHLGS